MTRRSRFVSYGQIDRRMARRNEKRKPTVAFCNGCARVINIVRGNILKYKTGLYTVDGKAEWKCVESLIVCLVSDNEITEIDIVICGEVVTQGNVQFRPDLWIWLGRVTGRDERIATSGTSSSQPINQSIRHQLCHHCPYYRYRVRNGIWNASVISTDWRGLF